MSPKRGGGLREQSTGGRRLLVGSLLSLGLIVAPLVLLGTGAAPSAAPGGADGGRTAAIGLPRPDAGLLGALSLAFQEPAVPAPTTTTTAPPPSTTTTAAPAPTTTTTTAAPTDSATGIATWYAAAPAGFCASPWLAFGTVLTLTDVATGAHVTCIVDDREAAGYPHVVDLSPSGFEALGPLSEGAIEVTISW